MVSYFYSWAPLVIVGAVVLLALPWLALVALMVFALAVLAAIAAFVWAVVAAPIAVGRAVGRHRRERASVDRPRAALTLVDRDNSYVSFGERKSGEVR